MLDCQRSSSFPDQELIKLRYCEVYLSILRRVDESFVDQLRADRGDLSDLLLHILCDIGDRAWQLTTVDHGIHEVLLTVGAALESHHEEAIVESLDVLLFRTFHIFESDSVSVGIVPDLVAEFLDEIWI